MAHVRYGTAEPRITSVPPFCFPMAPFERDLTPRRSTTGSRLRQLQPGTAGKLPHSGTLHCRGLPDSSPPSTLRRVIPRHYFTVAALLLALAACSDSRAAQRSLLRGPSLAGSDLIISRVMADPSAVSDD